MWQLRLSERTHTVFTTWAGWFCHWRNEKLYLLWTSNDSTVHFSYPCILKQVINVASTITALATCGYLKLNLN